MNPTLKLFCYVGFLLPYLLLSIILGMVVAFFGAILGFADSAIEALISYFLLVFAFILLFSILILIFKSMIGKKNAAQMDLEIWALHEKHSFHIDTKIDLVQGERVIFGCTPCITPDLRKRISEVIVTNRRIAIGVQPRYLELGFKSRWFFFMPIIFGQINSWHQDLEEIPKTESRLALPPKNNTIRKISYGSDKIGDFITVNYIQDCVARLYHPNSKEICKIFSSKMT